MEVVNDMPSWASIIGNFGFPIVLTIYLLIRFERKIESLGLVIQNFTEVINKWGGKLNK